MRIALFVAFIALAGCATEWGSKMRTTSEVYSPVPAERVELLFMLPTRAYKQIGIVSVSGSTFSSDVAMLKKLRKAAADLGADAVIVTSQYQGIVSSPTTSTTLGTANTSGVVTANGPRSANVNANTTLSATTVGTSGGIFSYPKNQGIAIKYSN
jgi:hypothetical protein